jgi:hypothetical protein
MGFGTTAVMARSVSISTLVFHNFRVGEDNIIGRYDKHKSDQSGESLHDKHIFGNPFDAVLCVYLSLGVWFALDPGQFDNREHFFKGTDTKEDSASHRFCTQLLALVDQYNDAVANHIRVGRCNSHSFRKGSGTYSQSGTTAPPPPLQQLDEESGPWGKYLIYTFSFLSQQPADTYLGRILAGLDLTNENFSTPSSPFYSGGSNGQ